MRIGRDSSLKVRISTPIKVPRSSSPLFRAGRRDARERRNLIHVLWKLFTIAFTIFENVFNFRKKSCFFESFRAISESVHSCLCTVQRLLSTRDEFRYLAYLKVVHRLDIYFSKYITIVRPDRRGKCTTNAIDAGILTRLNHLAGFNSYPIDLKLSL